MKTLHYCGLNQAILSLAVLMMGLLRMHAGNPELIFVSDRDGGREIFKVEAVAGAVPQRLTTGANAYYPSWSVRNDIVFQTGSAGHLMLLKADGTIVPLSSVAVPSRVSLQEEYPSWSPDGNMISYVRRLRQGTSTFYRDVWVRTTDQPPTSATDVAVYGQAQGVQIDTLLGTAWSPDGKQIAFTKPGNGSADIFVADLDTSTTIPTFNNLRQLTTNAASDFAPCWSPDGKWIAFQSARSGGIDIYRMNSQLGESDTANFIRLTTNPANDRNPAWSPDGESIAFVSERDGNREIYVMSATDGEQDAASLVRITTSSGVDENPAWVLNRTLVTVERTNKARILRADAPYAKEEIQYWGYVTAYTGTIRFQQNGQLREHPFWEAQDVIPAGTYHGKFAFRPWNKILLAPEDEKKQLLTVPAVHVVDAPVRPLGDSSIYIHYAVKPPPGTGFDDSHGKHWTTGCIVFDSIGQLISESDPTGTEYTIDILNSFSPLSAGDYMVSGTVTNPADKSGLPGVVVKVLRGLTEIGRMTTDSAGHYWISGLQPPGSYTVVPELSGYRFTGVRRSPYALPWLPPEFEHAFAIQTAGYPPDCYGIDFVATRDVKLRLFGLPLGTVQPDGTIQVTFQIKNTGQTDATGVTIATATLGTTPPTGGLPDQVGTVPAASSFTRTMVFPPGSATAGSWKRFTLMLTHTTAGTMENVPTSARAQIN